MKSRIKCFIVCSALLAGVLGFCSCSGSSSSDEANLMHIIVTYPNSSYIYVDGYGTAKNFVKNDVVCVKIDGKSYWTHSGNVLIVDGE